MPVGTGGDLKATLRKYQETGVGWLRLLSGLGLGACLADDMGLGKTVQVFTLLSTLKRKAEGHKAIASGSSSVALANWKAEMARFTPTLRALFVHPAETPKEELDRVAADPDRALRDADVVATSYGMLLRQPWLLGCIGSWRSSTRPKPSRIHPRGRRRPSSGSRPTHGSP